MKALKSTFLLKLCLSAFLLQALFPVGYMPAALNSGSPMQLCHSVFPLEFLKNLDTHQDSTDAHSVHAHHHAQQSNSADAAETTPLPELRSQETCSFGALNLDSFLLAAGTRAAQVKFTETYSKVSKILFIRRESSTYQARAPPIRS